MASRKYFIKSTIYDKRGRILSVGYNSYKKSHPIMQKYNKLVGLPDKIFLHAEAHAITKVKHGTPYKIKIERYGKNGQEMLAAPCPICQKILEDYNIKVIEYTHG
jgi:deoxycytidylate deaminase